MTTLLRNDLRKNLTNILSEDILMDYNIDGTHGKQALKHCTNVLDVILGNYKL